MERSGLDKTKPLVTLTHLDREEHSQGITGAMAKLTTPTLRKVRAWLADVVENQKTVHLELAMLRGNLINEEIERRAVAPVRSKMRLIWSGSDAPHLIIFLASFPDLPSPKFV